MKPQTSGFLGNERWWQQEATAVPTTVEAMVATTLATTAEAMVATTLATTAEAMVATTLATTVEAITPVMGPVHDWAD